MCAFYDVQNQINKSWNDWKFKNKRLEILRQRKKNFCPKCADDGFRVRMDYQGNKREKMQVTVYDVSIFVCPRCGKVSKQYMRIEGKGYSGQSAYKRYGGE